MLDFTNTPQRRKKAAQARTRKTLILLGMAIVIPAAASAFGVDGLTTFLHG